MSTESKVVYSFLSSCQPAVEKLYRWLGHYGLTPSMDSTIDNHGNLVYLISLPVDQIPQLRKYQHENSVRFGSPPLLSE